MYRDGFLLGTVDIRIRDINSMYRYNTWHGVWYTASSWDYRSMEYNFVLTLNFLTVQTGFSVSNITLEEGSEMAIRLSTVGIPRDDITLTVGVELATAEEEGTEVHAQEGDNALPHTLLYR